MAENKEIERVLVSGASGYIASHIVQQLQQAGYAVRGTVRSLENEAKIGHLKQLCPDAAHELELVEAQLENEESWKSAVDGCTYVLHTASPFPLSVPSDENTLIKPAVEGVTNVLKAVAANGKVKRVVVTSAGLAICGVLSNGEVSEKDWPSDIDSLDPYPKSKTLAEKAAWDFVENLKDEEKFELVVVHPVGVAGPILSSNESTSTEILKRLLLRKPFMVPKVNLPLVDVRDVAAGHIAAMKCPEAAGNRHILYGGNIWWSDMGAILREEFKPRGYNVPTALLPKFLLRMGAAFDKDAKMILPIWNKVCKFDNTRMKEVLKVEPRDLKTTLIDMAYSLIEAGIVKKSQKYRGPGGGGGGEAAAPAAEREEGEGEGEGDAPAPTSNGPTTEAEAKEEETKTEETKAEEAQPEEETKEEAEEKKDEPAAEPASQEAPGSSKPAEENAESTEGTEEKAAEERTPTEAPAEGTDKAEEAPTESTATKEPAPATEESKPAESAVTEE